VRYTVSFEEAGYDQLTKHLFSGNTEMAAYLLCRVADCDEELRLLVRELMPVEAGDVISASSGHMSIHSRSFLRALKRTHLTGQCFIFAHSHPKNVHRHSPQDDEEEEKLFATAYVRVEKAPIHASIVFSSPDHPSGRVWLADGTTQPVERVRVVGARFRFHMNDSDGQPIAQIYDRQVRAFGKDFQHIVGKLHFGIVGAGGTGSAVIEQLIRLGAGEISAFDEQMLADTNVTRVYGSRLVDVDLPKVKLMERLAADIGLGTRLHPYTGNITRRQQMERLRSCDVIFCCTDDQWGRSLLTRFAMYYYVPVIDIGVKIDSQEGSVHSVQGRVTVLVPGSACLFCRRRITPGAVAAESIKSANPEEANELRRQGYIPELEEQAPAVIPFTTTVAASAITELAHRLTGFMGADRTATEILHLIDTGRIRTNSTPPDPNCAICGDRSCWGRGDVSPLLDTIWPN
jgi:molybdopterin/thiamine biosynthesis adenylyltransferase